MSLVFPHTFVPWFRAVAPYIHAYRGETFVVGMTGEMIAAGNLAIMHAMGIKIVLVHGFRPQVNEQLALKGHQPQYSHGMRITDGIALDSAQEAAGQLRFEIEAAFSQGLPNTPMANSTVRVVSGNFLTARPVGIVDGVDFKHSGIVRRVDAAAIQRAIDIGAIVLMSPFGFSPTGDAFNLMMEDVATETAIALQADKLLFMTEVEGVRENPDDPESAIDTELALADAKRLIAKLPPPTQPTDVGFYLKYCVKACESGVERSHILPFAVDGAILQEVYTHDGIGTMVVDEKLESLREATHDDIGSLIALIEPFERDGQARAQRNRARHRVLYRHRARRRDIRLRGAASLPGSAHRRNGRPHRVQRRAGPRRWRAHPQAHRAARQGDGPDQHLRADHAHHALVHQARIPAGRPELAARGTQAQIQLGPPLAGPGQETQLTRRRRRNPPGDVPSPHFLNIEV